MVALGLFPFDAILPAGWLAAYLALIALAPLVVLGVIAIGLRLNPWRLPVHSTVNPATLPSETRRYAQPWLGRLGFLGFTMQGCTRASDGGKHETYVWRLVHGNDRCVALMKAKVHSPEDRPRLELTLLSFLPDGTVVVTADRPVTPWVPVHWHETHRIFKTLQEQVDCHRERMAGLSPVLPTALPERLAAEEQAVLDNLLAGGAFTPLPGEHPGAQAAIGALPKLACRQFGALFTGSAYGSGRRSDVASVPKRKDDEEETTPVAEGKRTPEEIVEDYLKRYRARTDKKPDGKYYAGRILLTAVTVGAMFFVFGAGNPLATVLTALGLMAIHEFGHWIMMKLFGYKGMGRFFIPFLSPLDRGRKLHAPAWQQLAVILAGPLPGLMVGMAVLVTGYFIPNLPPLAPEIGAMAVLLNAFHLLPFLPLDGGKVVDLLVFRDLPFLRPLFTLGSAIAVFVGSIFLGRGGRVLRYIAISMMAGLAWDIRMIKVVRGGRRLGWADAKDEDETLRRIFKGIQDEGNEEFFRDNSWPRQIEVLLGEIMRKRPGFLMRIFGGALYSGTFVLPFALVIGAISITYLGLFGKLANDMAASEEYQKDFPVSTTRITPEQLAPMVKILDVTDSASDAGLETALPSGEERKKAAAEMSAGLLPLLDRLNWQHASLAYHEDYFTGRELPIWMELLCSKLEAAHESKAYAEALLRAETIVHAVTSMEPAMMQSDREALRDAELRALGVIERLAAAGKLDATALQRLDSRISLLNKAPLPEVENKLLLDGWGEARVKRMLGMAEKAEAAGNKNDKREEWRSVYDLVGEGFGNLGKIGEKPVCLALAAEWKKSRRVGTLPETLPGADKISRQEAEYIVDFCDGHSRIAWRRLVTLSALRLEAHRLKKGNLPSQWKHTMPGGAIVALEQNAGPVLRLSDRRQESFKLPAWLTQAGAMQEQLDYDCPLFGSELSKK